MEVFDVTRRGTIYKEKRSKMYDFPIDAFSRGGRPRGRKMCPMRSRRTHVGRTRPMRYGAQQYERAI